MIGLHSDNDCVRWLWCYQRIAQPLVELTIESILKEFLVIKLEGNKDASFALTQKGLIKKVLSAAQMENCNPSDFLAMMKQTLGSDPDGKSMREPWVYSSIVGMLIYLVINTRLDITLAVIQVCHFNHNPCKQSHATAVKHILCYLKGTQDCRMSIKLTDTLGIDLYIACDFTDRYKSDPDEWATLAKSQMIRLANCPLIWKSQLLFLKVTLSVCEVEYSALSHSIWALSLIRCLLLELAKKLELEKMTKFAPIVRSWLFEDNAAALRTRYFFHTKRALVMGIAQASPLHHWEGLDTCFQLADGLTKPNVCETFQRLCMLLIIWVGKIICALPIIFIDTCDTSFSRSTAFGHVLCMHNVRESRRSS